MANFYVTTTGAGAKTGVSWANAFGLTEWEGWAETSATNGDAYFVMADATYTLTANFVVTGDGTTTDIIEVIGVKDGTTNEPAQYSDWAFGSDRPLIAAGANDFQWDDFTRVYNFRFTTTNDEGVRVDTSSIFHNCKCQNNSGNTNRAAYYFGGNDARIILCEGISDVGRGLTAIFSNRQAYNCYFHDSTVGVLASINPDATFLGNVFDSCTIGLDVQHDIMNINQNVFYNNGIGVDGNTEYGCIITNNIFVSNGTGAAWDATYDSNFFDYNCWSNVNNTINVLTGPNAVVDDPLLSDPASGDFTIQSGSPATDMGQKQSTNVGVIGSYVWNIGVDQDDNVSPGGGGSKSGKWWSGE